MKMQQCARFMLVTCVVFISACVGQPPVPEDHFYRLPTLLSSKDTTYTQTNNSFGLYRFRSDGLHNERAMLYVDWKKPLELQRYHYHHWMESPPVLIKEKLLTYLRSMDVSKKVVRYEQNSQVDWIIDGRIHQFEQLIEQDGIAVVVEIEFDVRNRENKYSPWHQTYKVKQKVQGKAIHSTVEAYGKSLHKIFQTFVKDLQLQTSASEK